MVYACWELDGDVWFVCNGLTGGQSGLARFRKGEWKSFETDYALNATQARDGTILVGGNDKFYIVSSGAGKEPIEVTIPGGGATSSVVKDSWGNLWVGFTETVLRYRPTEDPPDTQVTAVREARQGTNLNAEFHGIDRFVPRGMGKDFRFSWRLDSGPWSEFGAQLEATVATSGLAPGKHTLEVRSQNQSLQTDASPALLEFFVQPIPLQERAWFRPALAVLFLLITVLAITAGVARRKLAGYASQLEEMVNQRTTEPGKSDTGSAPARIIEGTS
jgi:hypothetical protein